MAYDEDLMGEDEDLMGDDDDFEGDDDDDFEGDDDDDDLMGDDDDDDEFGARRRRRRRSRSRRRSRRRRRTRRPKRPGGGTLLLKFASSATGIAGTIALTAQCNRDCRPLDLRVHGTTSAGVADPGLLVGDLTVHGKDLALSSGNVSAALYAPDLASLFPNCDIPEIIKSGETVTLAVTGNSAASVLASAVLYCRAKA